MTAEDRDRVTGPNAQTGDGMTAKERYDARTAVRISLKLNRRTDADVLQRLDEVPSKQGYIKELIREDIAKDTQNK